MAKDNNLQDFLTDIADAIREKKGTTEKINPQDFATEIANLSSGGGSGSGESGEDNKSNIEYLDISGWSKPNNKSVVNIVQRSAIVKLKLGNDTICTYTANIISWSDNTSDVLDILSTVTAIGIDFNLKIKLPDWEGTIKENLIKMGISEEYLNSLPRLIEEEFYNLND